MLRAIPFERFGLSNPSLFRGLEEFYGIQLHNLTAGVVLHIYGFVTLCEIFLSCEAHLIYGGSTFVSFPAPEEGLYTKWVEPKYGR